MRGLRERRAWRRGSERARGAERIWIGSRIESVRSLSHLRRSGRLGDRRRPMAPVEPEFDVLLETFQLFFQPAILILQFLDRAVRGAQLVFQLVDAHDQGRFVHAGIHRRARNVAGRQTV